MKRHALIISFLVSLAPGFMTAYADVRLPAVIGTHMVLQQNSQVNIWGWCDPGEKISIKADWDTASYTTSGGSNAKWIVQLKTPAAGGPFKITIRGNNSIVLDDVLTGEVWDCSGQSNMEMSFTWGVKQYAADMENGNNRNIRFFHIPRLTADYPQEDTKGSWVVCNPEDLKRFSLVGYYFGQQLQKTLNVPVGLINASWGGTPAEAWTPKDTIENVQVLKEAAAKLKPANGWPVNAGAAYNGMIHPITNFVIAGVLWYQGEANVGTASTYTQLLETMIRSWRKAWKKELPFYYVQIAPFAGYGEGIASAVLREAQAKVMETPKTGMVVVHDLVDNINDIHPQQKKEVGLRLANYALAEVYGQTGLNYRNPTFKSMGINKDRAIISFDQVSNGLKVKGKEITGFFIAGDDKIFMPAEAKVEGNNVIVWNKQVKSPKAVRFGFTNAAMPNLFNSEDLPVAIFRTDDWEVNTEKAIK
jgi:sialate O-acetylesterase